MRKTINKKIALITAGISLAASLAIGSATTYAILVATDKADQPIYTKGGVRKKSIFLDCDTLWNVYGYEEYYGLIYKANEDTEAAYLLPSARTITMSGISSLAGTRLLYVYEIDITVYDKMIFTRCNPDNITSENHVGSSGWWEGLWGRTDGSENNGVPADIITYNYFHIDSYRTNSIYCNYSAYIIDSNGVLSSPS